MNSAIQLSHGGIEVTVIFNDDGEQGPSITITPDSRDVNIEAVDAFEERLPQSLPHSTLLFFRRSP